VVEYEDGEQQIVPVRLLMNIKRFDTSSFNRATMNNRHIVTLKDANQGNIHLYQWEWANPQPTKRIAKITARHDNVFDVSLILLAVSGRQVYESSER
jgi:hypothetical protein